MEKIKEAYILNIILFILVLFSVSWMMSGLYSGNILTSSRILALRYFTIDSNILMGIIAIIVALDEKKVINKEKERISKSSLVLKLIGTTSVTLTMLVTIFFLGPTMGSTYGFLSLFTYSNFFLHLVNPILSIIIFLFYEKTNDIIFKNTITGIIPMLIYAVYYVYVTLTHTIDGVIMKGYDWYGFFVWGTNIALFVVIPIMILITYIISLVLWKLNKEKV